MTNQGLSEVTASLAVQTEMLRQILLAVSAEPPADSPLMDLLKALVALAEGNSATLDRIDRQVSRVD